MHLAKGLKFRAVVVMACDEGILPLDERIVDAADEAELDEIYETERRLLYVAATRAREHLLLTGLAPASEYLEDLVTRSGSTDPHVPARPHDSRL
jgi:superfamily I DNA/RNA helicase